MRTIPAIMCFAVFSTMVHAKIELRDVEPSHGQLGPKRRNSSYVQGDVVYVRYNVHGVQTDMDGRLRIELAFRVIDTNDKTVRDGKSPLQQILALGGDSFPGFMTVALPVDFPTGDYRLEVECTDTLAKQSASFQFKFTCKEVEFALVDLRFFQDEQGRVPATVGGTVSQTLFVRFRTVGFDRSKGEIDVAMELQIFDKDGKPMVPKPIRVVVHNEDPATVKTATTANFSALLVLSRAGDFQLKISLTDTVAKKTVTFESPMTVRAP